MGRLLVTCAAFPPFELGVMKSRLFCACLVEIPIGSSCKDIALALPGTPVGLGTAAKEGLQLTAHTPDSPFHDVPPFERDLVFMGLMAGTGSIANEIGTPCRGD